MQRFLLCLLLFGVVLTAHASAAPPPLQFKRARVAVRHMTLAQLIALSAPVVVKVRHPDDGPLRTFRAIPLQAVIDAVYPGDVTKNEDILFSALDGYESVIPYAWIRQHKGYIAYESADGQPFTSPSHSGTVDLGPYFIIWDNLGDKVVARSGAHYWPYQVAAVDVARFDQRFPAVLPPPHASPQVMRGFTSFRTYCLSCHTVNGQGGMTGPELNYPRNVTEYWNHDLLAAWIRNPKQIRDRATMPPMPPVVAHPERVIAEIIAYLQAMSHRKIAPRGK